MIDKNAMLKEVIVAVNSSQYDDFLNGWENLTIPTENLIIEYVDGDPSGEGQGEYRYAVLKVSSKLGNDAKLVRIEGYYSSWCEGDGEHVDMVVKLSSLCEHKYFKINGYYSSWEGTNWADGK